MKKITHSLIIIMLENNTIDYQENYKLLASKLGYKIGHRSFKEKFNEAISILENFYKKQAKYFNNTKDKHENNKTIPRLFPQTEKEISTTNSKKGESLISIEELNTIEEYDFLTSNKEYYPEEDIYTESIKNKHEKSKKETPSPVIKKRNTNKTKSSTVNIFSNKEMEQGFIVLEEYNEKIWFDMEKMKVFLDKEKIYDNDDLYWTIYYKNAILLNYIRNRELFEKNKELSESFTLETFYKYSPVTIVLKDKMSNFYTLSKEYKDFIESKDIQNKEYFDLILEWEEGTREYLDNFILDTKKEILDNYEHIDEEVIDNFINEALKKWSIDKKELPIFNTKLPFSKNIMAITILKEDNYFMLIDEWFKYNIPLDKNDDLRDLYDVKNENEIKKILLRTPYKQLKEVYEKMKEGDVELIKFWTTDIFGFKESQENFEKTVILLKSHSKQAFEIYLNDFVYSKTYKEYLLLQDQWVFNYNKNILESKKEAIRKYFLKQNIQL